MRIFVVAIAIGRLGTVWIRDRFTNRVFQSIVVLSFTGYILEKHKENDKKYPKKKQIKQTFIKRLS